MTPPQPSELERIWRVIGEKPESWIYWARDERDAWAYAKQHGGVVQTALPVWGERR